MSALISPEDAIKRYGKAQGNILKGHGRENVTLLFVEFVDTAKARQWIVQLLNGGNGTPRIISTEQQLLDRQKLRQAKEQGSTFDAGLFASLLFTAAGLKHLQVPAMPQEATNQAPGRGRDGAFAAGMRDLAGSQLSDPALSNWDAGWRSGPTTASPIHALLLLADDQVLELEQAVAGIETRATDLGIRIRVQEQGKRLKEGPAEEPHDIEHFGYADGLSQPLYLKDDTNGPKPHSLDTQLGAEELVLVPDALSQQPNSWGSFLVFRKLEQNVPGFKDAEKALGGPKTEDHPDALDLDNPERAGAMLVGRFENGTPVTMSRTDQIDNKPAFTNDFDYTADTAGSKCPFHAHIRKMNPRGETKDALELKHRITRRGIPYGSRDDAQNRREAGLLFMCYQRNIGQQFEFLQRSWSNNENFLFGHGTVGLDPIIGQGNRPKLTFPTSWDNATTAQAGFEQFVTLRGGEYFYAPSIGGLEALAQTAQAAAV
ncbi:Dyp-type peroxidase [Hymenobacter cellulosivorans]|uniref:Dyp-type peroxidase n=1 Tax=Hymenobacter cellulosivorans TaxID=2932249 RepID=A0ABY4FCY7_9BACT|nr:Dyp-type peroxidase [Hymenobacter cellulosivorans]UOQ54328.1 Dyp-type peroxidase [Hymenobacter cellulosivorans]